MCFSISNYFLDQVALGVWADRRHSKKGRKMVAYLKSLKKNNLASLVILPLFILIIVIIAIVIYISPPAVSCTADATVLVHNSYAMQPPL